MDGDLLLLPKGGRYTLKLGILKTRGRYFRDSWSVFFLLIGILGVNVRYFLEIPSDTDRYFTDQFFRKCSVKYRPLALHERATVCRGKS